MGAPQPPLPDKLIVPTRDALIQQYKDDYAFHAPDASTDDGTLPAIRATAIADLLLPVYTESFRQAEIGTLAGKAQAGNGALDAECTARGIPTKLPATGASGNVQVTTGASGSTVQVGDQLKNLGTGLLYQCLETKSVANNDSVAVGGLSTGLTTNVNAGTQLQWVSPRPGMVGIAVVEADSFGNGLSGGADAETDDQQIARIEQDAAFPAASGNDAAYQLAMQQTPGVAVQAPFTYPCCTGPGTSCALFLLRPAAVGGGRIPNNAQIGLVKANVVGQMPKDDSPTFGTILAQNVDLVLAITWADTIATWEDSIPWPPTGAIGGEYTIQSFPAPGPLSFRVAAASSPVQPQPGQNIALWQRSTLTFFRKRILTVSGSGPWDLTIDPTNGISDGTFTPATGDLVMPWSDSLQLLAQPIASYFDSLGPGEQINTALFPFFDEGFRQKRNPPPPQFWPNQLNTKVLIGVEELNAIDNVSVDSPTLPLSPSIGTLGTTAYLLVLNRLAAYPL